MLKHLVQYRNSNYDKGDDGGGSGGGGGGGGGDDSDNDGQKWQDRAEGEGRKVGKQYWIEVILKSRNEYDWVPITKEIFSQYLINNLILS